MFKPENDGTLQNESEHPLPRPLSRSCVAGEGRKMQSKTCGQMLTCAGSFVAPSLPLGAEERAGERAGERRSV